MSIDYDHLLSLRAEEMLIEYDDRDVMLYALGIGFGRDPLATEELPFVYEENLKAVPTLATTFVSGFSALMESGINFLMVVHGEQRLKVHRPIPPKGDVVINARVVDAFDKGEGKGALILTETQVSDRASGDLLCTLGSTIFARGDGGFMADGQQSKSTPPAPHVIPEREADGCHELITVPGQGILYRLNGDRNPIHIDPEVGKKAGFPQPILHGLCTYGTCCRGIIEAVCDYAPEKIKSFDVRFSAPVIPGETILLEYWIDDNVVSFRAKVKERDVLVINNGRCELSG